MESFQNIIPTNDNIQGSHLRCDISVCPSHFDSLFISSHHNVPLIVAVSISWLNSIYFGIIIHKIFSFSLFLILFYIAIISLSILYFFQFWIFYIHIYSSLLAILHLQNIAGVFCFQIISRSWFFYKESGFVGWYIKTPYMDFFI